MARSTITLAALARNDDKDITKYAMDVSNDHVIDISGYQGEKVMILIETSTSATTTSGTVTVKAGDYSDKSIGDLVIPVTHKNVKGVILETSRFKQDDNTILIDLATETKLDGFISAVALP